MRLYNPISQQTETFVPQEDVITMYTCGITPYDTTHLGHVFTYHVSDILIRYLEYRGHTVRYVQNVTDIDDDMLRKSQEVGEDWRDLGNRWIRHFVGDMQALNIRPPDVYPRATEVMADIKCLLKINFMPISEIPDHPFDIIDKVTKTVVC